MSANTKGKFGGRTKAGKRGLKLGAGGKKKLAQLRASRAARAAFNSGASAVPF